MCEYVGFAGSKSDQYKRFEKLKSIATDEELLKLTDHDSLAVVTYASFALLDKNRELPSNLIQKHLNKDHFISTFCGCIGDEETVSSLIYDRYRNKLISYPDEYDYENFIIRDTDELRILDSTILFSSTKDHFLIDKVLDNRIYDKKYLPIIEKWGCNELNISAIEYLVKHNIGDNRERIIESLEKVIKSGELYSSQEEHLKNLMAKLKKETNDNK